MLTPAITNNGPRIGIFDDISNDDYHCGPGISKSGLDDINQSPLHYITKRRHRKLSTPAMVIGSALHKLVLEPDTFTDEYVIEPKNAPKRPTITQINAKKPSRLAIASIEYWEKWHEENGGKIMLRNKPGVDPFWNPGDWDKIHFMRDAVASHSIAAILLDPDQGKAEQSVYWLDDQMKKLCKCRPDFLNDAHDAAVDLKSTEDASYSEFAKSCGKYRYHVQDAWYSDGLRTAGRPVRAFIFVAVEKSPPYGVGVYILNSEARRVGRLEYQRNLDLYTQCHKADEWPSYPSEVRDLELTQWALRPHIS